MAQYVSLLTIPQNTFRIQCHLELNIGILFTSLLNTEWNSQEPIVYEHMHVINPCSRLLRHVRIKRGGGGILNNPSPPGELL